MEKVILLCAIPRPSGNTYQVLEECANVIEDEGLDVEIISFVGKDIKSCIACAKCGELNECSINDGLNDIIIKIREADGFMYTTRRLRLLGQSAREPELMRWSQSIQPVRKRLTPPPQAAISGLTAAAPVVRRPPAAQGPAQAPAAPAVAPPPADSIRVLCNKCQTPMRIPLAVLRGKPSLNVRCPKCQNVFTLRPKPASQAPAPAAAQTKPPAPPVSPAAQAKPAATPTATPAAQTRPAGTAPAAAKPKPIAAPAPPIAKTKSPAKPSVATAAHKQAR